MDGLTYSAFGLLAIISLLIVNHQVLTSKTTQRDRRAYKDFLFAVLLYSASDTAWGLLSYTSMPQLLFLDTVLVYLSMTVAVTLCCRYILIFLDLRNMVRRHVAALGLSFLALAATLLVVNKINPLFFYIDDNGDYQVGDFRAVVLSTQTLWFAMMSVFSWRSYRNAHNITRNRKLAICLFGLSMTLASIAQYYMPLAPMNTIGFMFGILVVHVFVHQEEDMFRMREMLRLKMMTEDSIAANKAKTKFLQNMSHEIRTPLNAMFGFAQLLGMPDGSWTDEERSKYNSYIFNSYNMLDMLISDILDVADSENGNYRIEMSEVKVNDVCRNAMMSVEFRCPAGVEMKFTSDLADDFVMTTDARRIQQVLINYLTNACKNTAKGSIHLNCSNTEKPGRITFSVTDTGKGVPPEKADEIFGRFTKLNQFVQGSGLGLNICHTIASKLGGEVYLDTTYTGGARFVFVV